MAYVVETAEGLRMRFSLDDWQDWTWAWDEGSRSGCRGGRTCGCSCAGATEVPPVVWVTLARRVRAAG